jgi:hypothetical protein
MRNGSVLCGVPRAKREREDTEVVIMENGRLSTQDGKELRLIPTLLLMLQMVSRSAGFAREYHV